MDKIQAEGNKPKEPELVFPRRTGWGETKMKLTPSAKFELLWRSLGGWGLVSEYKFAEGRRFRFDFYHPSGIAIELEGGVWTRGRHTRPSGFLNDMEKYNLASSKGILVFRIPSHDISIKWLCPIIKTINERSARLVSSGVSALLPFGDINNE
jgi:hypothetical protein